MFENRILEEWLEEKVTSYFLCDLKAREVVPISTGSNFIDVMVKWDGRKKWFVRCFPTSRPGTFAPGIGRTVDMFRAAIVLEAEPVLGYVHGNRVETIHTYDRDDLEDINDWKEAA